MILAEFLWSKLSSYYHENDTNLDGDNKGTFERFLNIFGLELDEIVTPGIESFLNNVDPETAAEQYLPNISFALGQPDDILGNTAIYRELLTQMISIYQIKGTSRSYKMLFGLLGMSVTITEKFPGSNAYDTVLIYDTDALYDNDACSKTCIHYDLTYTNLPGFNVVPLAAGVEDKLRKLIYDLIQPVGAELDSLTATGGIHQ